MTTRMLLESTVLGIALENGYSKAGHILCHKNFSSQARFSHSSIWKAMEILFPTDPINPISVSAFLNEKEGISYHHYLACLNNYAITDDIVYYSLQLLELDIREKIAKALEAEEFSAIGRQEYNIASIFNSMRKTALDIDRDLFDLVDDIRIYVQKHLTGIISGDINRVLDSVPQKALNIKQHNELAQISKAFDELDLSKASRDVQELSMQASSMLNKLKEALDE